MLSFRVNLLLWSKEWILDIVKDTYQAKFPRDVYSLIRNVSRVTYSRLVLEHKDVSFGSRVTTTCLQDFHESLRGWSERGGRNLQKRRFTAGDFV